MLDICPWTLSVPILLEWIMSMEWTMNEGYCCVGHYVMCRGAERGDYTWNGELSRELHVDWIRSLFVNLNAIKRTQLLTEYNTGDEDVQYLRIGQHGSGKCWISRNFAVWLRRHYVGCSPVEKVEKIVRILYLSKRNHQQCSEKRFAITLRRHRSARIVRNPARSRAAGRCRRRHCWRISESPTNTRCSF